MAESRIAAERAIPGLTPALQRRLRRLFRLLGAVSPATAARVAMRLFTMPRPRPVSAEERQFLARARSRTLTVAGVSVQLYEWPAQGPAVLLVHGWRSHTARLRAVIEALNARGLRVAAVDAPGHGHSRGRRLDLELYCELLSAVAGACGPIEAMFAHSFGAMASLSWLADYPEAARVRAAVLVGVPRDAGYLLDSFTQVLDLSPAVVTRTRALFRRRYGREPESYCARRFAGRVDLPVLLVHGADDELVPPSHSEEVAAALADSELRVVPQLSHGGPLRDPATLAVMADFIQQRCS